MSEITTVEELDARCPDCGGPRRTGWWHTVDCPAPLGVDDVTGALGRDWTGGVSSVEAVRRQRSDAPAPSAEVGEVGRIESHRTNSEDRDPRADEDREALAMLVEWASRLRMDTPEDQEVADGFVALLRRVSRALAAARQPAPATPTQYAAALEDPALRRIAENARFGVGEVIDHVLRALGMEGESAPVETTTEWAVRWPDGDRDEQDDDFEPFTEGSAHEYVRECVEGTVVVSRTVTPWQEVPRG